MTYIILYLILSFGAVQIIGVHNRPCIAPTENKIERFVEVVASLLDCELTKYDVSKITMSVLSPQNLSLIEEIKTVDEFKSRGCCNKPTLFTHHGYLESKDVLWNTELQSIYASTTQGCAIAFDYSEAEQQNYFCTDPINVDNIGKECARKVYTTFVQTGCLAPQDIVFMGFSTGTEIAIRNAYNLINTYDTAVKTVYCMDPAGPVFNWYVDPPESFYFHEVAKNVSQLQCIHTSALLGTNNYNLCPSTILIGSCGKSQPECRNPLTNFICDHFVSPSYLIASYVDPGSIIAKECAECEWWQSHPACSIETEVAGYQSTFKKGKFRHEHAGQCIDFYYTSN